MALRRQIATCLAVAGTALALAACGEDSPQGPRIPEDVSDALISKLDEVEQKIDAGECSGNTGSAQSALASLREGFEAQTGDVSPEIVADGRELLDRLTQQVNDFCDAQVSDESSTTSTTTSTTTTSTEKSTTEDESTESSTTDETTKETTTEPPETTTEEPPPPGNGPGGNGPPGQDGGFESGDDGGFAPGRSAGTGRGGRG